MATRAQTLFGIIDREGVVPWIKRAITERMTESEFLDFKTFGNMDDNKKNWAKALSGFANNEGGIIVWGVGTERAPHNGVKVDKADVEAALADPAHLEQVLRNEVHRATIDPVMGIDFRTGLNPDGKGFLVCYIPEGAHKPYRYADAGKYYTRYQDDFKELSHAQLRAMFYPVQYANIKVYAAWTDQSLVKVYVYNAGNRTAKELTCYVRYNKAALCAGAGHVQPYLPEPAFDDDRIPSGNDTFTLHPRQVEQLWAFRFNQMTFKSTYKPPVDLIFTFYMLDHDPQHRQILLAENYEGPFEIGEGFKVFDDIQPESFTAYKPPA